MKTQCSELFFRMNAIPFVAMQQQPRNAEPEIFPLSAQDGKVCGRYFIQMQFQFDMSLGKFANKLFDFCFCLASLFMFLTRGATSAGVDQGLFGCQGHRCHNVAVGLPIAVYG